MKYNLWKCHCTCLVLNLKNKYQKVRAASEIPFGSDYCMCMCLIDVVCILLFIAIFVE